MLKTVTPKAAARLPREDGATLVDVREADEHARERMPGAGLVVAGVTATCGLARVLRVMPWNRMTAARPATA